MSYFHASGLDSNSSSEMIRERLGKTFFLTPKEVEQFNFKVEYISPDGHFAIIRFAPRDSGN